MAYASARQSLQERDDETDSSRPSEAQVVEAASSIRYTEILLNKSIDRSYDMETDVKGKTVKFRQLRMVVETDCYLTPRGLWSHSVPDYTFSFPRVILATREVRDRFEVKRRAVIKFATGADLSAIRMAPSPESDSESITWSRSTISGDGLPGFNATEFKDDYRLSVSDAVSAVMRSADEAANDQNAIFRSGIGLGIVGSLIAWIINAAYDLIVVSSRINAAEKERQTESLPTATPEP